MHPSSRLRHAAIGTAALFLLAGCSKPAAEATSHVTDASPPLSDISAAPAPSAAPVLAEAPVKDASTPAPPEEPSPKVKVISIGMHVAGGPYDEETKKPFLRAVEPHYADLARCWKHVTSPRSADVGVDLLIPPAGGKPKVSNPRSTVSGEGFVPCVVAFFQGIEFDKPKSGGQQVLSYSVRFKP